ncbi:MAG: Hpt domain-containing protein [Treponema sp.]|nr:Hpt domain-containing protein [Candidatus Treponema caballi]
MNKLCTALKNWGCDVEGAMVRCLNDEDFYCKLVKTVMKDPSFENLGRTLEEGNVNQSFDIAHSLKGSLSNVGLTPLYDLIVQIVEPLRGGNIQGLAIPYLKLTKKKEEFDAILMDCGN